jgi:alkylation response protein AidB-like acyl-CoA dehydrogenase
VLDGGEWVIHGQKIWTSGAERAQMMYLLCRTELDASKHAGLSYLLVDMSSEGIAISPLKTLNGETEFSQVFLDGVRTPATHLVGKRGEGWHVSRSTLKHERGLATVGARGVGRKEFDELLPERYAQAARDAVEAHGGIGFTWECDVQIWLKRALFDRHWLGGPVLHHERSARLAGW